jgi:hypothetical protein
MSNFPKLIGLTGFARSGKSTVAELLSDHYGYSQTAIAAPLKKILYEWDDEVAFLVDEVGWEKAKEQMFVRERLQRLGQIMREAFDDRFLIRKAVSAVSKSSMTRIVVSDVRTEAEANAIWMANGYVVRVTKQGVGPANDDITEQPLDADYVIVNDGTVDDLLWSIDELIDSIKRREEQNGTYGASF